MVYIKKEQNNVNFKTDLETLSNIHMNIIPESWHK